MNAPALNVLALEASTSSAKAMVMDAEGRVVAAASASYPLKAGGQDCLNADVVFGAVIAAGAKAVEQAHCEIAHVALSSIWHSMLPIDADNRPLSGAYTWASLVGANVARAVRWNEQAYADYAATGCPPHTIYAKWQWKAVRDQYPNARSLWTLPGYLFYRLTGEIRSSRCFASGTGWYDLHTKDWAKDAPSDMLPPLCNPEDSWPLNDSSARALNIPCVNASVGASDGALTQIGSFASSSSDMTLSIGTSGALRVFSNEPLLTDPPETWCYALDDKAVLCGAATSGCGNCLTAWRPQGGFMVVEDEMNAQRDKWAQAPIFLPFAFGERCPGWHEVRKSGFTHAPENDAMAYYSIMEGVLLNLKQCYDALIKLNGAPKRILLSGGILHSPAWIDMAAGIFDAPIYLCTTKDASLAGAAMLALKACGIDYADIAPPNMYKIEPAERAYYAERYAKYLHEYAITTPCA